MTMELRDAVRVLHETRGPRDIVVTSMGSAREWMALGPLGPLDFVYVPSSMGQATSVALGLALARPDLRVIVCSGDGSLLMNLGSLVTIASQAPANLRVLMFENGAYEVTGAQPTPATIAAERSGAPVDFAAMAMAAGISSVFEFDTIEEWRSQVRRVLDTRRPTFAVIRVESVPGAPGPRSPSPAAGRATEFAMAVANA